MRGSPSRTCRAAALAVALGLSWPAAVAAAPKNYCADLKGVATGSVCQIRLSDPGYSVSISFPSSYPDMKAVAGFISRTRDDFLDVAKSPAAREVPYSLDITASEYNSAVPPRGQQSVVLTVYRNVGAAHPQTAYKSFVWDQTFRKPVTYENLWQPDADPLPIVLPAVQQALQKQTASPVPVEAAAGLDPANYQNFAITNDGVIFFFSQGTLLPEAAGAVQALVPRAVIDRLLA